MGQSLMQSQRLASRCRRHWQGSLQAIADMKDSADVLARNLRALNAGDAELGCRRWANPSRRARSDEPAGGAGRTQCRPAVGAKAILTQVGEALRAINQQSPALLESAEGIAALKLQNAAPAADISAAGQLVMLTQRIGKSANEFQAAEGVKPRVGVPARQATEFPSRRSPRVCWLAGTRDAQTREQLQALITLFDQTRTQAGAILAACKGLAAARQAQAAIVADSEPLRRQLETLQDKLSAQSGVGPGQIAALVVAGLFVLLCGVGVSRAQLLDSRGRQVPPRRCRSMPSARSRRPSASTTPPGRHPAP